jgi:hypothetical protein
MYLSEPALRLLQPALPINSCPFGASYPGLQCFIYWRIFAKIRPKKCDFDHYKGFFMRKMVQIRQISKIKKFKSPDFFNKFQKEAKNIEGSWFFSTFISGT